MGRARKKIDVQALVALAANNVTKVDIAALLGCSVDTLDRRYKKMIERARAGLRRDLAMAQIEVAKGKPSEVFKDKEGNVVAVNEGLPPDTKMLIWMGKQLLGQKDKQELTGNADEPITVKVMYGVSMDDI